jgi:hypothetical protein
MFLASMAWPQHFSALHHNLYGPEIYNGHLMGACQGTSAPPGSVGPLPAGGLYQLKRLFSPEVILLA